MQSCLTTLPLEAEVVTISSISRTFSEVITLIVFQSFIFLFKKYIRWGHPFHLLSLGIKCFCAAEWRGLTECQNNLIFRVGNMLSGRSCSRCCDDRANSSESNQLPSNKNRDFMCWLKSEDLTWTNMDQRTWYTQNKFLPKLSFSQKEWMSRIKRV